jgi:hypothetical protein
MTTTHRDLAHPSVLEAVPPESRPQQFSIAKAIWLAGALFCAAYATMALLFPWAVASRTHDVWAMIQGVFTSADYSFGPHSAEAQHPLYLRALHSLSVHTIAGGAALLAATTQFVPTVRRRWPLFHRTMGALVVLLVAVSMIGSVVLLASHPLASTLSGAGFGIGLMSLCGLTLFELTLAVLAVRARDYRSHMGWMALLFASLLTAPALRLQWLLFGATGLRLDEANLVISVFLVPETILLMACWTMSVGARDLGIEKPTSILPFAALRGVAALAAMVAFHEGCLAPFGLDLIRAWRGTGHALPGSAVVWGVAAACLAWRVPRDLMRLDEGGTVRAATMGCAVLTAAGAFIVAVTLQGDTLEALAQRSVYGAWGVDIALLSIFGRRAYLGYVAPWDAQWLYLALAPALWPFLAWSYAPLAVGASVAAVTAMAIAFATVAMLGFASAFGLKIRGFRHQPRPLPMPEDAFA